MNNIVKYLRRSKDFDLTQDELADLIGVSRATISSIENGANTSIDIALRISKVFQMDPREIFFTHDVAQSLQNGVSKQQELTDVETEVPL
ncbi:helix-turn-helix transcriptional regulator [Paenibacillus melissococcoides]|uniref:Helix-turn-helix transcriptional regulator n=1 Tax=Paenibacillus melissococcoides TaxID=2912268 RepID=A0ABN8U547_9BACL|nr:MULTISPECIES: helix-turn-helix transcriptional regulator [Paenibacillus]CAH8246076.1 helix-turn-helix transcriptional regulator [Paenibacillus melissococcoides]CAH8712904.1 helix-turn-helix transcriptional regulator [Paenibacillus melissococcoides]CAH8713661.1 helix-turn-helix transcriptional regulator [Paenibacillus melissococcoides]